MVYMYQNNSGYIQVPKQSASQRSKEMCIMYTHNNHSALGNHDAITLIKDTEEAS